MDKNFTMTSKFLKRVKRDNIYAIRGTNHLCFAERIWFFKGLIIGTLELLKLNKKYDYRRNRTRRLEKQKIRDNKLVECPICKEMIKKNSLFKHKNNNRCTLTYLMKKELNNQSL